MHLIAAADNEYLGLLRPVRSLTPVGPSA
jgi:hypothetical protein